MSYVLERFGTITLPAVMTIEDISPVAPIDTLVQTTSGVFDNAGGARSDQKFPQMINMKTLVAETDPNVFRATIDALRALVGTRDFLYRRAENDSSVQKSLCRLVQMPYQRQIENWATMSLDFKWQQLGPWLGAIHGVGWSFDAGILLDNARTLDETPPIVLDTSTKGISIVNAGNLPVTDIQFTLIAQSAPITTVLITGADWSFRWDGTLVPGATLMVDTGASSATVNGTNAYAGFSLTNLHNIDRWARMAAGTNSIVVSIWGGGTTSTLSIIFYDGWA